VSLICCVVIFIFDLAAHQSLLIKKQMGWNIVHCCAIQACLRKHIIIFRLFWHHCQVHFCTIMKPKVQSSVTTLVMCAALSLFEAMSTFHNTISILFVLKS
jgi:hypothetical protein